MYPDDYPDSQENRKSGVPLGRFQQMVRSEILRGRFRNSYEQPEPFVPNRVEPIKVEILDILHTFRKGHKIMIQIQSSWFPLADRNPQKYVENIYQAKKSDFVKATHSVYRSEKYPSKLEFHVIP